VTLAALSKIICLAWGIYGRTQLADAECDERAREVLAAAGRHRVDPVLMVAVDVQECDLRDDVGAPFYKTVRGRRVLAGRDHCPMGVRTWDSRRYARAALYDEAARRLSRWKRWCAAGHPGGKYRGAGDHHFVSHYNPGNPAYESQVMTFYRRLRRLPVRERDASRMTPRTREIERRLARRFSAPPGGQS